METNSSDNQDTKTIPDLTDDLLLSLRCEVDCEIEKRKKTAKQRTDTIKYSKKYDGKWLLLDGQHCGSCSGKRAVHIKQVNRVSADEIDCDVFCEISIQKGKHSMSVSVNGQQAHYWFNAYDKPKIISIERVWKILFKSKDDLLKQFDKIL